MVRLLDVIQKIYQSYGFEVKRSSEFDRYILLGKDDTTLAVGFWTQPESIKKKDFIAFMAKASSDDAHKSIFISSSDFSAEITGLAKDGEVQLWNKDRFEKELGRAILSEIEDTYLDRERVFGDFFAALKEEKRSYKERGFIVSSREAAGDVPPDRCAPKPKEEPRHPPTGPDPDAPILKPLVPRSDAENLAKRMGDTIRMDMGLIPHLLFDYYCETTVEGRSETEKHMGHLAVNGFTQTVESWNPDRETVESLKEDHTRLESKVKPEDAAASIKKAIIQQYTTTVESIEERDSATIIEKKKVKPKEDAIEIQDRGIVYLPVWCVEGSKGVMLVDATDGRVIKEDPFKR